MTTADDLAQALFARAQQEGQAVVRCGPETPDDDVRARVRALARAAGVKVRTGIVDGAVVVARTDAGLWTDDAATMRAKLAAPSEPDRIG